MSIFVFAPAALILGIIARGQIKQTGEQGAGMALAAIICGGLAIAFMALMFLVFVVAFGTFGVGEVSGPAVRVAAVHLFVA